MMLPNDILGNAYELADDGYIVKISRVKRRNPFGYESQDEYRQEGLNPSELTTHLIWRTIEKNSQQYGNQYLIAQVEENVVFIKREFFDE